MHYKKDIPEIINKLSSRFPTIEFKLAKPIGYEPTIVRGIHTTADQILSSILLSVSTTSSNEYLV
ncbi:MAG: hypothetical protein GY754_16210 [bacterium]|nr:hypothetical protein [bacterium]